MGRKQTAFGSKIGEALDCSADWQTDPQDCDFYDNIGLMLDATAVTDNLGVFFVEVRCRKDANNYSPFITTTVFGGSTYSIIPLSSSSDTRKLL